MNFLPMNKLGPHESGNVVHFGILLPGIDPAAGFRLAIRVIHEKDQFIQTEPSYLQALTHSVDPVYGDYWETQIDLSRPGSGRNWGQAGRYIYRYVLTRPDGTEFDWIIDPFAREFGVGRYSSVTYQYAHRQWSPSEAAWKTPKHHDLILYEMNIMEFAGSLPHAIARLDYLQDLGINCISLMPVTNISDAVDWGYTPIGYFGVDERFGRRSDFQEFVDEAHQRGIAVLVDAIYGHTSSLFGYEYLYNKANIPNNPIMGSFSKDMFGPSVDWTKQFAQDFFFTVNRHWLDVFHVDGFRYDCVPNYWELFPNLRGYASIVYHTYQHVKNQIAAGNQLYMRFDDGANPVRLIQCAEQLEAVKDVLNHTYSTSSWQENTLSACNRTAQGGDGALVDLGKALGADDLPTERTLNGDKIFKSPLQYIENHDKNRFVCNFGICNPDSAGNFLFEQGDRSQWFKTQPYLIGMLMSKGIPLLWQGQEICENPKLPNQGMSRTGFLRMVRWEYFYDDFGRSIINLVRKLITLRRKLKHVRDGEHFFFNHDERYHFKGCLLFARYYPNTPDYTLVALNFTGQDQEVPFWFPVAGDYREELHGTDNLHGVSAFAESMLKIPSNYGRIWTHV